MVTVVSCLRWLTQTNYIGVTISPTTIVWPLIQYWRSEVARWYDVCDVEWCCCLLLCVDAVYMDINFIMSWMKIQRNHTNLKTVFFSIIILNSPMIMAITKKKGFCSWVCVNAVYRDINYQTRWSKTKQNRTNLK